MSRDTSASGNPRENAKPALRGGQGLEPEMPQIPRRPDIPGIGDHKTSALMQLAERCASRRKIGGSHKELEVSIIDMA